MCMPSPLRDKRLFLKIPAKTSFSENRLSSGG